MKKLTAKIVEFKKIIILFSLFIFFAFFAFYLYKVSDTSVEGWSENIEAYDNSASIDLTIKNEFLSKEMHSDSSRYEALFKYFAYGFFKYQSEGGAYVYYTGAISSRGRRVNGIEGFARFFPLAASWINSRNSGIITSNNETFDLLKLLKNGLLNGTNPNQPEYWGNINDKDQRIVEAADIALALWLSREYIWNTLQVEEKNQIVDWLNQSLHKNIVDNNWNLFPITIVKSLQALGYPNDGNLKYIQRLYDSYKSKHYLGSGWFDDPPMGVDYYNAWSIHYSLFWLDQIDPNFDRKFIHKTQLEFIKFYKYFFGPKGFPIMGRSVCYRLAAPSPILSGLITAPEEISPGLALRTLNLTWDHFIKNNALQNGKVTQGYYEDDLRLLDGYSGAGSCLWSLRSLIIAFYMDNKLQLFSSVEELLPIEQFDYSVFNKTIGWTIIGNHSNQKISLQIDGNFKSKLYYLEDYTNKHKIKEFFLKRPLRPNNKSALYKNYIYTNEAETLTD